MPDPEVDDTPPIAQMREHIKELEQQAKSAADEKARADGLERRLAFIEAGINLSDPKAKYFVNGYEGDLTPEAIKATAIADGYLPAENPDPDVAALARMNEASAPQTTTPTTQAAYEAELASAVTQPEVMAVLAKYGRLKPVG